MGFHFVFLFFFFFFSKVYSWGDNDHGQQGNGNTMVNQKPTPVDDFGNVKVNRVACGSSHSVAWQAYEPPVCTSVEPITFDAVNDPLGANILGELLRSPLIWGRYFAWNALNF